MFTVTVHTAGTGELVVRLPSSLQAAEAGTEDKGPSPIAPEVKELAWGAGAFIVLFVLMRLVLFPRVKNGMQARYGKIRDDHESADAMRAAARGEVADYEKALAGVSFFGSGARAVIGMPARLALRDAAVMNGVLIHGLDYDDTHLEGVVHASASCFSCAFGVAAEVNASGRDLIAGLRQEGKTVFMCSHILSDIEVLCDRVAILKRGRLAQVGNLDELRQRAGDRNRVEIVAAGTNAARLAQQSAH